MKHLGDVLVGKLQNCSEV